MQQLCKQATESSCFWRRWKDSQPYVRPESSDALKLCLLPAARRLDTTAVAALLTAAAEYSTTSEVSVYAVERHRQAVEHVCSLPGAQNIGGQQLAEIIQDIISSEQKRGSSAVAAALCQLPAAVSLSRDLVGSLLTTAVQRQWLMAVPAVCRLPGASELSAAQVQELLWQVLRHAQKLRAVFAFHLEPEERDQLLWQEGWLLCAGAAVCGLAAAQQLDADGVVGLLQRVLEQRLHAYVPSLCGLAGAARISGTAVAALLRQTISWELDAQQQLLQHDMECVACLCGLAGARQLDDAALVALLTDAVMVRCGAAVVALCKLPAAASIAVGAVQELKQLASRYGDVGVYEALSGLDS
jgi:hypothetical protein